MAMTWTNSGALYLRIEDPDKAEPPSGACLLGSSEKKINCSRDWINTVLEIVEERFWGKEGLKIEKRF
jgi:hypothetical protein